MNNHVSAHLGDEKPKIKAEHYVSETTNGEWEAITINHQLVIFVNSGNFGIFRAEMAKALGLVVPETEEVAS